MTTAKRQLDSNGQIKKDIGNRRLGNKTPRHIKESWNILQVWILLHESSVQWRIQRCMDTNNE